MTNEMIDKMVEAAADGCLTQSEIVNKLINIAVNNICISNGKVVTLTKGKYAILDDIDYPIISQFKWHANSDGYARTTPRQISKKNKQALMHRMIMERKLGRELDKEEVIDHINRHKTDNRRENLRLCSMQENRNNFNIKVHTSKYKGVRRKRNRWLASIMVNYKLIHLGSFDTELEAAQAYRKAYIEHFGNNFPHNLMAEREEEYVLEERKTIYITNQNSKKNHVQCAFCQEVMEVYTASFKGCGKECLNCGAVLKSQTTVKGNWIKPSTSP